jgi:hypothetical protein
MSLRCEGRASACYDIDVDCWDQIWAAVPRPGAREPRRLRTRQGHPASILSSFGVLKTELRADFIIA